MEQLWLGLQPLRLHVVRTHTREAGDHWEQNRVTWVYSKMVCKRTEHENILMKSCIRTSDDGEYASSIVGYTSVNTWARTIASQTAYLLYASDNNQNFKISRLDENYYNVTTLVNTLQGTFSNRRTQSRAHAPFRH